MPVGLIESSQEGDATVARVACRQIIDQTVINSIFQQVSKLSENQRDGKLVVDLADVEYMSGVTLSMFVLLDQAAAKGGNRVGYCQLSPSVDELFRVSRFHKVVNVFGTRKEAIDGLTRNGHQSGRDKLKQGARRNGEQVGVKQLAGIDEVENESTMSGILPGLSQSAGVGEDESGQIDADRAEMYASDLPTFAEPELEVAENLSDLELADAELVNVEVDAPEVDDVPNQRPAPQNSELAESSVPLSKPDVPSIRNSAVPDVSHGFERTTLIGDGDSDEEVVGIVTPFVANILDLDGALAQLLATTTNDDRPLEQTPAIDPARSDFLEADWGQVFEAAECDFVLDLRPESKSSEKPQWVMVDPVPSPKRGANSAQPRAPIPPAQPIVKSELITLPKAPIKTPATLAIVKPLVETVPLATADAEDFLDDEDAKSSSYDKHFVVLPTVPGDSDAFDHARAKIVGQRHVLLAEFLRERKLNAILLTRPSNFAWFTAGGQPSFDIGNEPTAALLITPGSRTILCRNSDTPQMLSHEVAGLGFDLHDRMWFDDPQSLLSQAVRGREVASDQPLRNCTDMSHRLADMRLPLAITECQSLRHTSRVLSRILEITARKIRRGECENDVAAQLMYRLAKNDITPVRVQVHADGRWQQNRQWNFGDTPIERFVTMSVVGRRKGLHMAISRTVSFGPPPIDLQEAHRDTLLVQATAMYYSQHRADISEPWDAIERVYEKYGRAAEWQSADLGCVTGYELCETTILPDSRFELLSQMPLIWRAAIGPAFSMDTMLVRESIFKVLTKMEDWPHLAINVKGTLIARPDILVLPAA